MVEPRRKPADFLGAQFQVAVNNGPNGAVPYLYAVFLCRGKGPTYPGDLDGWTSTTSSTSRAATRSTGTWWCASRRAAAATTPTPGTAGACTRWSATGSCACGPLSATAARPPHRCAANRLQRAARSARSTAGQSHRVDVTPGDDPRFATLQRIRSLRRRGILRTTILRCSATDRDPRTGRRSGSAPT